MRVLHVELLLVSSKMPDNFLEKKNYFERQQKTHSIFLLVRPQDMGFGGDVMLSSRHRLEKLTLK
jgi:hypothetical protein